MSINDEVEAAAATILAARLQCEGGRIDDVPELMKRVGLLVRSFMERASLGATTIAGGTMVLLELSDLSGPNTTFRCDGGEDEFLTCQVPDCGMKLKMLKRHLLTVHGMTPNDYRRECNLPGNTPMVTSSYAELRSQLAKKHGLGKRRASQKKGVKKRT